MLRIASLIPSGTDVAEALGLGDALVGVSHGCDAAAAHGKPVLTSTRVPTDAAPAEIDRAVVQSLRAGESLYVTDRALLAELAPDVVLSQDVCDVCALSAEQASCDLPAGARLVMLTATDVAGLEADLRRVGEACGVPERAERRVRELRDALAEVEAMVRGAPRRRVLALEWSDPPFLGGHWVPELVALAGGEDVLARPREPSRRATWDEIAAVAPEIVLFMPCGYDLEAARREAESLRERLPPSVTQLWATDATRLFSRCTPQAVARGARTLASILHPDRAGPPDPRDATRLT